MACLDPVLGSEQGGRRPAIIIQNDVGNDNGRTTIIAPFTTAEKAAWNPAHVLIKENSLIKTSWILLEQIRTIDRVRLEKYLGCANDELMRAVDRAIMVSLGLSLD